MTAHEWDSGTPYCTRCGIQKGCHAEECLATPNVVGFMHHLARRRGERAQGSVTVAGATVIYQTDGKIIVEAFPPTESA